MNYDCTMKLITAYHARDLGFHFRSCHTRVNPGAFPLNTPKQNSLDKQTSMLTRHCIFKICIQFTKYRIDHKAFVITNTHPTPNCTEELLHSNIIKVALHAILNQKLTRGVEYYGC